MTSYLFTLKFPPTAEKNLVTQVGFQVSGGATLPPNQMPPQIDVGDTLTFSYQAANPDVAMSSCLLTRYNVTESTKETDSDFMPEFDTPLTVDESWVGSWVFHLLGLYKLNGTKAAFYLDPEVTFS